MLTNPLRNADPAVHEHADQVYTEQRPYGQSIELDQLGGSESPVHDHHRWSIDDAADAAVGGDYRRVRAVFDGDLYIARRVDDDETDPAKVQVWLALSASLLTAKPLPTALAAARVVRPPSHAFYGNIQHSSLANTLRVLGHRGKALDAFLDLERVPRTTGDASTASAADDYVASVLPVLAGDVLGEVGEITLDDGSTARALDFRLSLSAGGRETRYPLAFYEDVADVAPHRLQHGRDFGSPAHEMHGLLSVWSVCARRLVLQCRDEWNHPLGQYRAAALTLVRDDGVRLDWTYPPLPAGEQPTGVITLGSSWVDGHGTATVEARPYDRPMDEPLMMSAVPSEAAAAASVPLELARPTERMVQALDPRDWFPAQGGKGWPPVDGEVPNVALAAPHVPARWTNGNRLTPLVDSLLFNDVAAELDGVTGDDHYVCGANWWLDDDFPLAQVFDCDFDPPRPVGDPRTLRHHLERIAGTGASVFWLCWDAVGGPHQEMARSLPAGPLRDLWESIEDWAEAARTLAVALVNTDYVVFGPAIPGGTAVAAINAMGGAGRTEAVLDGRHRPGASHHAKMGVVRNANGLVAWVGGTDLNTNRVNTPEHHDHGPGRTPYHDVHLKIEGPAARDVLRTFLSRWNDHPGRSTPGNGKTADLACAALGFPGGGLPLDDIDDRRGGTNLAQIARTHGNCRNLGGATILNGGSFVDDDGYAFAPNGEFTIESAVLGAIKQAKRFIYIEDQFLGNMKIATAVADKIAERKAAHAADKANEEPFFVFILVPFFPNDWRYDLGVAANLGDGLLRLARLMADGPNPTPSVLGRLLQLLALQDDAPDLIEAVSVWGYMHTRWHNLLRTVDPTNECWQMHCLRLPPYTRALVGRTYHTGFATRVPTDLENRHTYIHAKTIIVDDVWATVGSANVNVRSHTLDSEINCSFIDGRTDDRGLRVSVRDFRRRLWAEHLGIPFEDVPTAPPNDPFLLAFWKRRTAAVAANRLSAMGTRPLGSRLFAWPYEKVNVDSNNPPIFRWSRGGVPLPLVPSGVKELPQYWWLVEEYGKAPWAPVADDLMPPLIGSPRFAFDGRDGSQYLNLDIVPHRRQ